MVRFMSKNNNSCRQDELLGEGGCREEKEAEEPVGKILQSFG